MLQPQAETKTEASHRMISYTSPRGRPVAWIENPVGESRAGRVIQLEMRYASQVTHDDTYRGNPAAVSAMEIFGIGDRHRRARRWSQRRGICRGLLCPAARLPFRSVDDLVVLTKSFDTGLVSPTAYLEWSDRNPPFSELAAFMWWEGSGQDAAITVSITPNYFDAMGVKPMLGRVFTAAENRAGFSSAMILSYQIWQRKFGGDPAIVGRRIKDGDWSPIVVGVMPPAPIDLRIGWGDVWRPIRLRQQYSRSGNSERILARRVIFLADLAGHHASS